MADAKYPDKPETQQTNHKVEDLSRETILKTVYPVTITESRYNGTYSGGQWVATANLYNPREQTEAFGSDMDAATFWSEKNPHKIVKPEGEEKVYAASGETPEKALDNLAEEIKKQMKDRNIVKVEDGLLGDVIGYYNHEKNELSIAEELNDGEKQ